MWRRAALTGLAAAAVALSGQAAISADSPPVKTGDALCELHVWGARKAFAPDSKFAAPFAPRGTYHADQKQPLANINTMDPLQRLAAIEDTIFDGFFGRGVAVKVIRHSEMLDPKTAHKAKLPLSSATGCYGDLVVSDLVDIEYPDGGEERLGVIGAIIAAPAGLNMQVSFRRFDGNGKMVFTKKDGVNGLLTVPRSNWQASTETALASINAAAADGIRDFHDEHIARSESK
jgi:hypothetical protein